MKILFLCHSIDVGGLETYMLRFARWLSRQHEVHELHLLCKSGRYGFYESDFRACGVRLYAMPLGYFAPAPYLRFYRFLLEQRYDALCDFGGDFGALPVLCAQLAQIPKRAVFYRNACAPYAPSLLKSIYQRGLNRLVRKSSTDILSNSHEAFSYYYPGLPALADPRFRVLDNGIATGPVLSGAEQRALRAQLGVAEQQKLVLHVGSARWEKNHPLMLAVAKRAQDGADPALFCFAGPGVEETYGQKAKELGLTNVRFLGVRTDVWQLLQIADVFLFPSLCEGQPNALLEAILAGVPFIASDIAAIRASLPPSWSARWLCNLDQPDHCYLLLKEHLEKSLRQDLEFAELVRWAQLTYDENRCFAKFRETLLIDGMRRGLP